MEEDLPECQPERAEDLTKRFIQDFFKEQDQEAENMKELTIFATKKFFKDI